MLRILNKIFRTRATFEKAAVVVAGHGTDTAAQAIRLGNQCLALEQYEEALRHYERAQALDPACVDAYICQAYACQTTGQLTRARGLLRDALRLAPRHAEAHYMLGSMYRASLDFGNASRHIEQALQVNPHLQPAYGEWAEILVRLQDLQKAARVVTQGLVHFPRDATLHLQHGNLLVLAGAKASAAESYRQALACQEDFGAALMGLGACLSGMGKLEEAVTCMRQALELEPHNPGWHSDLLFTLQYRRAGGNAQLLQMHLDYASRFEKPWLDKPMSRMAGRTVPDRLKVGYVSGDFRGHSMAYFIEPVLRLHNRQQVEVFCYYTHPTADGVTQRLQQWADHWRSCADLTDEAMAQVILDDRIDILVDLSGHTAYNRLPVFARKPAPIQMTWLGYQSTTGLASIDYRITDASLDPPGETEQQHSEQLLRLPSGSGVFQPEPHSPPVSTSPGLAREQFTFGCLNNTAKMSAEFLETAARVLKEAPASRLLLGGMTEESEELICGLLATHGIGRERLVLLKPLPTAEYMRLHGEIDLALDTFPYNGGTTTMHSLWMGVPILALDGTMAISRVGSGTMRGLGLAEFSCANQDDYVRQAVMWSNNRARLEEVRASLRTRTEAMLVGRAHNLVEELEEAFRRVFTQALRHSGTAP